MVSILFLFSDGNDIGNQEINFEQFGRSLDHYFMQSPTNPTNDLHNDLIDPALMGGEVGIGSYETSRGMIQEADHKNALVDQVNFPNNTSV